MNCHKLHLSALNNLILYVSLKCLIIVLGNSLSPIWREVGIGVDADLSQARTQWTHLYVR